MYVSRLRNQRDLALVFAVMAILLILFAPIPSVALDLLIITNFAFAFTILLLTIYVERPVDFSTFPSLLLIATLFRLSLNIAATRLILSGAEAGQVIGAIGEFVVQGNFVIGLIVFFILIVVQYVVVTNGAQRVSEVAARFVLDAMPGQQMSIDADLNMGLIDQNEARARRKSLEKEAAFYGSMDGASKFVKGDAIAGIVIMLIDILGGWAVGVAQMGMPLGRALQQFTLLTIGDGIVTQVPALIISVATGIIVTRSSSDGELSNEVFRQLVQFPKIRILVTGALIGLLILPGMPKWPILVLVPIVFFAWRATRGASHAEEGAEDAHALEVPSTDDQVPPVSPIEVGFGPELARAWIPSQSILADRIAAFRKQYAEEMGVAIPAVVFRDVPQIGSNDYRISLFGNRFGQATLYPNKTLAIHPNAKSEGLPGIATRDPAFGLPAIWIEPEQLSHASSLGYTAVDPITVLVTHVTEVARTNVSTLMSRTDTVTLLEGVRTRCPGLVEELVPNILSISDVQTVLQGLLSEHVPIRNIDLIAEVLADAGRHEKDPALLCERVRQKLGHSICQRLLGEKEALAVLTLDPVLENTIAHNLRGADDSSPFVLDPGLAESFLARLAEQVDAMLRQNLAPALLCRPELRRHLKIFSRRIAPRLAVLSMNEIPHAISLRAFGMVSVDQAASAPLPA
ncbi:flagellar biosynthesis protein FlhA [Burkholderia ubonensis]|uniref:flagellar biosynthesis protein FlhA n=1 Tax=Burkholderia ubonensis TaxID=101571 RepID=UPI0007597713|nr:flagellar biosynthesis protein FlhA [Burkholderia ubonensis]KVG21991.1 flagellar biosynthesis protein FlhA [Burkholderia ubonensis]KVX80592.1 flagellar biosynthesis protein FlhA [Burkholderia ubonensis]OJA68825.1 flagellar biosynthesis protein FlhA [Burkholderia ubonensis]OJB11651.1 flagellar biosynthesis protein FlhA [Burkholderia ubonensis]OJB61658.1 flagellar biosynthesis protein FlhA [Burkholderia ubonensis]